MILSHSSFVTFLDTPEETLTIDPIPEAPERVQVCEMSPQSNTERTRICAYTTTGYLTATDGAWNTYTSLI